MNIYKVSREDYDYDEFNEFVVIAESEEDARNVHPSGNCNSWNDKPWNMSWIDISEINTLKVELIGVTDREEVEVVVSSFNAG